MSPTPEMRVIWHDVECGAYTADLPLWEELAEQAEGTVLDLGCGTGRVSLHLARREHQLLGLDLSGELVKAFNKRAGGLPARAESADARSFALEEEFDLVLAPMQLLQLFTESGERAACLAAIAAHLRPEGLAALAIAEEVPAGSNVGPDGSVVLPVMPDSRELDGWVYSSLPLEAAHIDEDIVIRRLRQTVSTSGELGEEIDEIRLRSLRAATIEEEAASLGLKPIGRREVPATEDHVGSTVVLLEKEV